MFTRNSSLELFKMVGVVIDMRLLKYVIGVLQDISSRILLFTISIIVYYSFNKLAFNDSQQIRTT